jgi:hypothetical protein
MREEVDEPGRRGVRRDVAELVASEVSEKSREKVALAKMGDDHLGGFMTTYNRLSLNPSNSLSTMTAVALPRRITLPFTLPEEVVFSTYFFPSN